MYKNTKYYTNIWLLRLIIISMDLCYSHNVLLQFKQKPLVSLFTSIHLTNSLGIKQQYE